jgi:hypothetical protein
MHLKPLPSEVGTLVSQLHASPRLIAHLTLVHDVACQLTARLDEVWPGLPYDRNAVQLGAALHDIGKTIHPEELTHPGHAHELAGEALLQAHGFSGSLARLARTHGQWTEDPSSQPEDLLVAIADTWWRGKRDEALEAAITRWIVGATAAAVWQVFAALDNVAADITREADARLAWQQRFPV